MIHFFNQKNNFLIKMNDLLSDALSFNLEEIKNIKEKLESVKEEALNTPFETQKDKYYCIGINNIKDEY